MATLDGLSHGGVGVIPRRDVLAANLRARASSAASEPNWAAGLPSQKCCRGDLFITLRDAQRSGASQLGGYCANLWHERAPMVGCQRPRDFAGADRRIGGACAEQLRDRTGDSIGRRGRGGHTPMNGVCGSRRSIATASSSERHGRGRSVRRCVESIRRAALRDVWLRFLDSGSLVATFIETRPWLSPSLSSKSMPSG